MDEEEPPGQRGWYPKDPNLPSSLRQDLLVALQKAVTRPAPSVQEASLPAAPEEVQQSSSSAPGRNQTMGRRTFRIGDSAFYWSATHRTWLKTCVLSVNRDGGDKSETYNLDCKSKVEPWQMRTVDEPRDGPPDCSEGAGGGFAVGMPVQCFNQQKRSWEDGIVVRRYQQDKIIVFDVEATISKDVVRMLPASRLRLSRFAVGDKVEYWSLTSKSWLPAKVLKLYWSKQTCDLDIKKGAPLVNVRKVNESAEAGLEDAGDGKGPKQPAPVAEEPAETRGALPRRRRGRSPSEEQPPSKQEVDALKSNSMPPPPPPTKRRAMRLVEGPVAEESRKDVDSSDNQALQDLREGRKLREDRLKRRSGRDVRDGRNGRNEWRKLQDVRDVRDM